MCVLCAAGSDGQRFARRTHVLQLLALIEHPDALHAEAALRLAREVLMLSQAERTERECNPVTPPGSDIEEACREEIS